MNSDKLDIHGKIAIESYRNLTNIETTFIVQHIVNLLNMKNKYIVLFPYISYYLSVMDLFRLYSYFHL